MSTMTRNPDTSVTFSLAELTKLEQERVREEDARRAREREERAKEQRASEARRRADEAAEVAAQTEARARREREEAEAKARLEARELAAVTVARIEAEARARLEADNALRAHELVVLRTRNEGGRKRLQHALAAVLALAVCGGSTAAFAVTRHVAGLEQEAEQLRQGQLALAREREQAKATELAALDRRHAALGVPARRGSEEARAAVDAARAVIDAKSVDPARLRAFADALDVLSMRLVTLERVAELDRRQADLAAWAAAQRRTDATAAARAAALRAKAPGADEAALRAYETALDRLRDALAEVRGGHRQPPQPVGPKPPECTEPGDPLCGLDGKPL